MTVFSRRAVSAPLCEAPLPFHAEFGEPLYAWRIMQGDRVVDVVRSGMAAMFDVDALNSGRAHVDRHACLGCRVVLDAA